MVIYLDELFIKNFLMTFFILSISAKTLSLPYRNGRLICASIVSTLITILLIIYDINFAINRVIIINLTTYIAYKPNNLRTYAFEMVAILIMTFITGGIMRSSVKNIFEMLVYGVCIYIGVKKYSDNFKRKKFKTRNCYYLSFNIGKNNIRLNAFLDTGNFLSTSLLNEPVIIISEQAGKKSLPNEVFNLLKNEEIANLNYSILKNIRPISYSTINSKNNISYGLKVRNVQIKYNENEIVSNAVIILSKEDIGDFDALIGITLLEGGIENGNVIDIKTKSKEIIC